MRVRNNIGLGIFVQLKNDEWLEKQRVAGKVAAKAITLLTDLVKSSRSLNLLNLDKQAETFIKDNGCDCSFLGYRGFPNCCCISVNKTLVHGVPNDYVLQEGDLVSFDLGATYKGAIADTAATVIVGKAKNEEHYILVNATKDALRSAIRSISIGKHLGVIGEVINSVGKDSGFSVVEKYGGHSIGIDYDGTPRPHMMPFVSNKALANEGIRFAKHMLLAIEPLFVIGTSNNTNIDANGWDVVCENICAHEEHTVYIHENNVEIITLREEEQNVQRHIYY